MSASTIQNLYEQFERDRRRNLWMDGPFPEGTFARATEIARAYVARTGTRTLDTLHVAAALELKAERFWTFDDRQAKLAKAVGLKLK